MSDHKDVAKEKPWATANISDWRYCDENHTATEEEKRGLNGACILCMSEALAQARADLERVQKENAELRGSRV